MTGRGERKAGGHIPARGRWGGERWRRTGRRGEVWRDHADGPGFAVRL